MKSKNLLEIVEREQPKHNNHRPYNFKTPMLLTLATVLAASGSTGCMSPIGSYKAAIQGRYVRSINKPNDIENFEERREEYLTDTRGRLRSLTFRGKRIANENGTINGDVLHAWTQDQQTVKAVEGQLQRYDLKSVQSGYQGWIDVKSNREVLALQREQLAYQHIFEAGCVENEQEKYAHVLAAMVLLWNEDNDSAFRQYQEVNKIRAQHLQGFYNEGLVDRIVSIPYAPEVREVKGIYGKNVALASFYTMLMSAAIGLGIAEGVGLFSGGAPPILPGENPIIPISYNNNKKEPLMAQSVRYPERFHSRMIRG